jgi:hypothetical protein
MTKFCYRTMSKCRPVKGWALLGKRRLPLKNQFIILFKPVCYLKRQQLWISTSWPKSGPAH